MQVESDQGENFDVDNVSEYLSANAPSETAAGFMISNRRDEFFTDSDTDMEDARGFVIKRGPGLGMFYSPIDVDPNLIISTVDLEPESESPASDHSSIMANTQLALVPISGSRSQTTPARTHGRARPSSVISHSTPPRPVRPPSAMSYTKPLAHSRLPRPLSAASVSKNPPHLSYASSVNTEPEQLTIEAVNRKLDVLSAQLAELRVGPRTSKQTRATSRKSKAHGEQFSDIFEEEGTYDDDDDDYSNGRPKDRLRSAFLVSLV